MYMQCDFSEGKLYTQKKDLEALQQNSSNGSLWDVFTIISCESEEMHHFFF